MDVLQISKVEYWIGNGITRPLVSTDENGKKVVIKLNNNIESNVVLVNEYIGYKLSEKLGLPVAKSGIGVINEKTVIEQNVDGVEIDDVPLFSQKNYGLCFYSTYIENVTIISSSKMVKKARNHEELIPRLFLFDHLIYNIDRNKGNLLLTMNRNDQNIILIDNSHAFKLGSLWDSYQFKIGIEEADYNDTTIMQENSYLYKILLDSMKLTSFHLYEGIKEFREKLTPEDIKHIVDGVPAELGISSKELEGLKEYLIYRLNNLESYVDIILKYKY